MDLLPEKWRQQVLVYRAKGCTWSEIEELSRGFEWDKLEGKAAQKFPDRRIPETTLARWYDLRVEQVNREIAARSEQARTLAQAFAGANLSKTDEAVVNALRDTIFAEMQKSNAANREDLIEALTNLGMLLTKIKTNEIRERKVKVDELAAELAKRKTDAALKKFEKESEDVQRKLAKGKTITLDDLNKLRERTFGLPPLPARS